MKIIKGLHFRNLKTEIIIEIGKKILIRITNLNFLRHNTNLNLILTGKKIIMKIIINNREKHK